MTGGELIRSWAIISRKLQKERPGAQQTDGKHRGQEAQQQPKKHSKGRRKEKEELNFAVKVKE